jgi:ADP-heptose:LPS heptosyltransferase
VTVAAVRAVLALRPRAMGDVVLTGPALAALRRGHPRSEIHVLTDRRYAGLVRCFAAVDAVFEAPSGAVETARLAARLRGRRYEVVVDFFGNPRTAFLTWASGAPRTVGWDVRGRRHAYRVRVPRLAAAAGRREYAADTQVRLAAAAGGIPGGESRLAPPAEAEAAADRLLRQAGIARPARAIGLVAAGTWATKTLPLALAALFARRLRAAGREVLLLSGPGEERVTATMLGLAPGVTALPECDVVTLAAVVARLGGVAGTDSGPRHLAVALGVPTFAWFGPTHPENWTPPEPANGGRHAWWATDLPCRACGRVSCPHWSCLPAFDPAAVAGRALQHFDAHERTADLGSAAGA